MVWGTYIRKQPQAKTTYNRNYTLLLLIQNGGWIRKPWIFQSWSSLIALKHEMTENLCIFLNHSSTYQPYYLLEPKYSVWRSADTRNKYGGRPNRISQLRKQRNIVPKAKVGFRWSNSSLESTRCRQVASMTFWHKHIAEVITTACTKLCLLCLQVSPPYVVDVSGTRIISIETTLFFLYY